MDFNDELNFMFAEADGSTAYSMERDRPYDGQAHTDSGLRGKAEVKGLTIRDIADCIVRGFLDSSGMERRDNPIWDDVYKITNDLDYIAVVQNATCWIEKYMGIYPNINKDETEEK